MSLISNDMLGWPHNLNWRVKKSKSSLFLALSPKHTGVFVLNLTALLFNTGRWSREFAKAN